jgi:hypothetical protein
VIRQMGARWSDEHIAATLNRMGSKTPFGHTWSAKRVAGYRRTKGIPGYESAVKDGRCLTMVEAAEAAGVSCHAIRVLIQKGILPAKQYVFDAPWQILAVDLDRPEVQDALRRRRKRAGRPSRISKDDRTLKIPGTWTKGAQWDVNDKPAQLAFPAVVRSLDVAVLEEKQEAAPLPVEVAERFPELRLGRDGPAAIAPSGSVSWRSSRSSVSDFGRLRRRWASCLVSSPLTTAIRPMKETITVTISTNFNAAIIFSSHARTCSRSGA